jgi:hypothetical protein
MFIPKNTSRSSSATRFGTLKFERSRFPRRLLAELKRSKMDKENAATEAPRRSARLAAPTMTSDLACSTPQYVRFVQQCFVVRAVAALDDACRGACTVRALLC